MRSMVVVVVVVVSMVMVSMVMVSMMMVSMVMVIMVDVWAESTTRSTALVASYLRKALDHMTVM